MPKWIALSYIRLVAWSCEYPNIRTGEKGVEGGWKRREGRIDAPEKETARLAQIATRQREGQKTYHQSCSTGSTMMIDDGWFVTCFPLVQSPSFNLLSTLRSALRREWKLGRPHEKTLVHWIYVSNRKYLGHNLSLPNKKILSFSW